MRDPYEVLGVSKNASDEELKTPTVHWPANTILTTMPTILFPTLRERK